MTDGTTAPRRGSRTALAIITHPGHANAFGTIHGGVILRLADECGATAAARHAGGGTITTAAIDSFTFLAPVFVGERVEIAAEVTAVGRTSIEARIEVIAERLASTERRRVGLGYGLYVALDEAGRPRDVPPLETLTDEDRARDDAARRRRAERLARRDEARAEVGVPADRQREDGHA